MNYDTELPEYAIHVDGKICGFFGPFRFLSNFYITKQGVWFEEMYFPSVEHAYQAAKWPYTDRSQFIDVSATKAKRLGKLAPNFNSKKWNKKKYSIMYELVSQKFLNNSKDLQVMLLMTEGCHLEERNNWGDQYWGTNEQGEGENNLGKILMDVRTYFKLRRREAK